MNHSRPSIVIIAGPNGAGKTTTGPMMLKDALKVDEFVNADIIASGLSAFNPEREAIRAGRIMIQRLRELARSNKSFAYETTLSGRYQAQWLRALLKRKYQLHIIYLWLSSPEMAVERVAARVRMGGHDVPVETIRRRYFSGLKNFLDVYRPMADTWRLYDNSSAQGPRKIASGDISGKIQIDDKKCWDQLLKEKSK